MVTAHPEVRREAIKAAGIVKVAGPEPQQMPNAFHRRQDIPVTSERKSWIPACIGIGSNLDDPVKQVRQALLALKTIDETQLIAASSLYRNPPMGPIDQPDYVNAAATLLTLLSPLDLLARMQDLERAQGRDRTNHHRWGPRRLDLDILTYGNRKINEPALQIPHPGISERNFVLFPLLEIAPQLHIPGLGLVGNLVMELDASSLERIS